MNRSLGLLLLVPPVAAYAVLGRLYPEIAQGILLYCAFAVPYILLPSYAFARLLLPLRLGVAERICLGYPISQGALFLLAWGGSRLGTPWAGYAGLPLLSLYALWDLWRSRREKSASEPFFVLLSAGTAALALAACFLHFLKTPLPTAAAPAGLYYDDALIIMGTFSAAKAILSGLPFMDGRFGDLPTAYHILLLANNAVAHLLTRVHPYFLQLYIFPVLHWTLTAGTAVAACRRLAGFSRTQTALTVALVFFTTGFTFDAIPWIQTFAYFHTYFCSLPSSLALCLLLYGVLSGRTERIPALYSSLLFFTAGAAKAVFAVQIPLALLPVLAYRLAHRKIGRNDLVFIGAVLATAVLLRGIEYQSTGQLLIKKFNLINSFMTLMTAVADCAPFLLPILVLAGHNRLTRHKLSQQTQYGLFVLAMFVVALVLTRSIEFVGGGQYFFWYARLTLCVFAAGYLAYAFDKRLRGPMAVCAAVLVLSFGHLAYSKYRIFTNAQKPAPEITLDRGEWDGLMWAHDHLDSGKRFICNRFSFYENRRGNLNLASYYDYLSVSGLYGYAWVTEWLPEDARKIVAARLEAVNAFWRAKTTEERWERLQAIPVDYMMVSKRFEALDYSGLPGVQRVYASPSLDIYALPGGVGAQASPAPQHD